MRLSATKLSAISYSSGFGDSLYNAAGQTPSLDLNFATRKSLTDAVTGASLVTFTRSSIGTYTDSAGVLQTAVTNLLLRSEEFQTTWAIIRASISADATNAPNGTLTADRLIDTTDNNTHVVQQSITLADNTSYAFSVFVKADQLSIVRLQTTNKAGTACLAYFNLLTGAVSNESNATGLISPFQNGWYRCTILFASATGATAQQVLVSPTKTAGTNFYMGNGTDGLFLWGAQLEQSATVGEYIPTTSTINSAPRFDHNPTTGESLGLLMEEQRTNLVLRSEEFDNAAWGKARSTVTANATASPTGAVTADKLVEDTTATNNHQLVVSPALGSAVYTLSVFAKAAERTQLALRLDIPGTVTAIFDLSTGVVVSTSAGVTGSITPFANGWYRVTATLVSAAALSNYVFQLAVGGSVTYTGDGTSGIYIWGAQLEAGAFPTSYIKTEAAATTRSADVASITGSAFSGWYRQDEGTMFADFLPRADATVGVAYLSAGNVNEATRIFYNSAISNYTLSVRAAGSEQSSINNLGAYVLQSERILAAYKVNDLAASRNGGASISDTLATLPTGIDRLELGTTQSANYLNGTIKRLAYWPQRLANSTLQTMTQ